MLHLALCLLPCPDACGTPFPPSLLSRRARVLWGRIALEVRLTTDVKKSQGCAWDLLWCFSPVQLHPEPARRVNAETGLPAAAAGQQGALGGAAAAAAGAAAAGERGAQAAAAGRAAEADRGAEGAEEEARGGNWLAWSCYRWLGELSSRSQWVLSACLTVGS